MYGATTLEQPWGKFRISGVTSKVRGEATLRQCPGATLTSVPQSLKEGRLWITLPTQLNFGELRNISSKMTAKKGDGGGDEILQNYSKHYSPPSRPLDGHPENTPEALDRHSPEPFVGNFHTPATNFGQDLTMFGKQIARTRTRSTNFGQLGKIGPDLSEV